MVRGSLSTNWREHLVRGPRFMYHRCRGKSNFIYNLQFYESQYKNFAGILRHIGVKNGSFVIAIVYINVSENVNSFRSRITWMNFVKFFYWTWAKLKWFQDNQLILLLNFRWRANVRKQLASFKCFRFTT